MNVTCEKSIILLLLLALITSHHITIHSTLTFSIYPFDISYTILYPFSYYFWEFIIDTVYEYMALKHIAGVSDNIISAIIEKRGTISGIFQEKSDFFYGLNIQTAVADKILAKSFNEQAVESQINRAKDAGISIITLDDERYPKMLKEIHTPPALLFVLGNYECLNNICVGVVGSRNCSKLAENFAYKLAKELSAVGITVVSGFAYGIDMASHKGAIQTGATACVLGSGLANIYPAAHTKHIGKILEKGGCLVSEFFLDEAPLPQNFPRRNRIISGLSKAIAVIEAGYKSGSLITCKFALEQNRDIFAVPAFPSGKNSATNSLLRQGAKFLETSLDIISDLQYDLKIELNEDKTETARNNAENFKIEDETGQKIYDAISIEPLSLNSICIKLGIDIVSAMNAISDLELDGIIEKANDGKYIIKII